MSEPITFGQAVLSDLLPPDLYRPGQALNKKGAAQLFSEVADRYPERYGEIASQLMRLGLRAGESFGGASFDIEDLQASEEIQADQREVRNAVARVLDTMPRGDLRDQKIREILIDAAERMPGRVLESGKARNNKFITQLEGAGRGNAKSLSSILAGDMVAFNSAGKALPIPITRGYGQGQQLAQYLAGAYEGRSGIVGTKLCLSGDTSVRMADGSVKDISDIQVGDMVLGADEEGRLSPVKVLNTFQNGVRECYEYRFRHNCCLKHFVTLTATPDHKILAAKRLAKGPFVNQHYRPSMRALREASIYKNPKKNIFVAVPGRGLDDAESFGDLSVPEALIAGLMLGDGCMAESAVTFQLSCGDPLMIEDVNPMFREFGMELKPGSSYGYTIRMLPELSPAFYAAGSVGGVRAKQTLTPLKRWLIKHLGRKLAHQKKLPADVWSWDEASLARLLAGIFSTDGCFSTKSGNLHTFTLAMTAKELLEEVKTLLAVKFGIWATPVSLARRAGESNSVNDLWSIMVTNKLCMTRLKERIGPYLVGVKRRLVEQSEVVVKYSEHFGKLLSLNKFGFKLQDRTLVGSIPTYDIEVDHPNHAFLLANGLIVSNSVASSGYLCFVGSTLVRMADGSAKRIDSIVAGEWVLGADQAGNTFPVKVLNAWDNGLQSVNKYTLRLNSQRHSQFELVATEGHQMLVQVDAYYQRRFRTLSKAPARGTYVKESLGTSFRRKHRLVLNGPSLHWSGSRHEKYAWEIGYLIGDGCLSTGGVNFATADAQVLETIRHNMVGDGFRVTPARSTRSDYEWSIRDDHPALEQGTRRRRRQHRFRWRLKQLGLIGKTALNKHIPEEVWGWDKCSICELISGLLEADGCFTTTGCGTASMRISMASREVICGLRDLLSIVLGVHGTVPQKRRIQKSALRKSDKMPNIPKGNYPMWDLSVTGYHNLDRLIKQLPVRGKKLLASREKFASHEYKTRMTTSANLTTCESAGFQNVYDIEVDHPDHLYVLANGLVVSNSKVLQQAAHRALTVAEDDDSPVGHDRGLLVDLDDDDNIGSLLARDYGPYRRNTIITPKVLAGLKQQVKGDKLLVRSPVASSSLDGGVYAKDVGVREYGRLPLVGEQVGVPAAQAIGEQITQSALGAKHGAGSIKRKKTPGLAGFSLVERLANPPQEGYGMARHASQDGRVDSVQDAPQGGRYVMVGDKEHYIPPDFTPIVKVGDVVEAGDAISDGIPDPAEVANYRGLGEGRKTLVESMRRGLKEAGFPVARRNLELLARGLYDRVEIEDEFDEFLPGSVVPYSRLEKLYRPREGHAVMPVGEAIGRYLETPTMHFTIGTRVTPRIRQQLDLGGVRQVDTHPDPPAFKAKVVRASDLLQTDPDFMTRFMGSHLQDSLMDSILQAGESDEASTSFVPVRARGVDIMKSKFVIGK